MIYELRIPAVPPSGNVWNRTYRYDQARLKADWYPLVANAIQRTGARPALGAVRLEAELTFKSVRRRDICNYLTTIDKLMIDHVVSQGILTDDNAEVLREVAVRFHKGKHEETVLRFIEL